MDEKNVENEVVEESIEESDDLVYDEMDNETFTYTVDNNNVGSSKRTDYSSKKSYIYMIIGFLVLLVIIVLLIVFANKGSKKSNYSEIESKMVSAAKSYYGDNEGLLPVTDGGKVSVEADTLISNNYLKPFSEFLKNDISCTGYVEVYKNADEFSYFPTLNCGEEYSTSKVVDKIINDGTVTSGDGLYQYGDEYFFRGEFPKNYVSFDDKNWRIIKINSDKSLKMILVDRDIERNVWDDRYNSVNESYSGINDFRVSRVLEYLTNMYNDDKFLSKKNKSLLVKEPWCIGKFSQDDVAIANLNLCNDTYNDLYIGLVTVDEVLKASIDSNCTNIYDGECTNYNYFMYVPSTWTLNASTDKSFKVYGANSGSISVKDASDPNYVRAVININSNATFKKGTGTSDDPYVIGD